MTAGAFPVGPRDMRVEPIEDAASTRDEPPLGSGGGEARSRGGGDRFAPATGPRPWPGPPAAPTSTSPAPGPAPQGLLCLSGGLGLRAFCGEGRGLGSGEESLV